MATALTAPGATASPVAVVARRRGGYRLAGALLLLLVATAPRARRAVAEWLAAIARRVGALSQPPVRKNFLVDAPAPEEYRGSRAAADAAGERAQPSVVALGERSTFGGFRGVLPGWLSQALERNGFETLKPIQRRVLPLALAGQDVVGVAPTGSGKTLAFLVPAIVHVVGQPAPLRPADGPCALVLAPTRELAVQIGSVAESLLRFSRGGGGGSGDGYGGWSGSYGARRGGGGGLHSAVLYGGARRTDQLSTLRFNNATHIVVATPGRLLDFLRHGAFSLRRVSFFVLDEGDRMLDFGFEEDVAAISAQIRRDRQMLFFSATWPPEVEEAAKRLCGGRQAFARVSAGPDDANADSAAPGTDGRDLPGITLPPREIMQVVEVVQAPSWDHNAAYERKVSMLLRYLDEVLGGRAIGKAIIFVQSRVAAEELGVTVAKHFGLERCGVMHGQRKQDQREATLRAFRDGRLRAVVCTDVLGRGVDIEDVSHVVIFDFPRDIETYVHRVGRTGRNGRAGTSVAFFEPQPWYPDLARELCEVLRACGQEVPAALEEEERRHHGGDSWAWSPNGYNDAQPKEQSWATGATVGASRSPEAPPLEERGNPPLAEAWELAEWDAQGARVWAYSANGGVSEQGRFELRAEGLLRTTWGWGEWALVPSKPGDPVPQAATFWSPHCPPPSRPCPGPANEAPDGGGEAAALASAAPDAGTGGPPLTLPTGQAPMHMALTWNGVTDVVALCDNGMAFELVSRNGRPAGTYRKKTVGRALLGITEL